MASSQLFHIRDNESDAKFLAEELRRAGYKTEVKKVWNRKKKQNDYEVWATSNTLLL
jgi:hypothetical protein